MFKIYDIVNEIVYDGYKVNGYINTVSDIKKLYKVIKNHFYGDDMRNVLRNRMFLKKEENGDYLQERKGIENEEQSNERQYHEVDRNENLTPLKYTDSGNVSPESLQVSSFCDDSKLEEDEPTIIYTPESFLREEDLEEEHVQN